MFASLVGLVHQPSIAVRFPNDDSSFNPKEFPSITFVAKGKVQGKIRLIHGTEDDSGQAIITTRIWVTKESDKNEVAIRTSFDNKTHTFTLEGPNRFGSFNIYHETSILIPSSLGYMGNLIIEAPNTSFSAEKLDTLSWNIVKCDLSNSTIALQSLHADSIDIRTSNSSVSGLFEAGHIDINTSNGPISAKLIVQRPLDGGQSSVTTKTSNASITLHVDASSASTGLRMGNSTKNSKIVVGTLLGPSSQSSSINTTTANGKIEFNLDASRSGQALEVSNVTANGSIASSIMVPQYQPFKGYAKSSNGSITMNLTEDFSGRFDLSTSNSNTVVEGNNLQFDEDKKTCKRGSHGKGSGDVNIVTSNSSIGLRFYPAGKSLGTDKY
ncbi:hypothetical protein BGZ80_004102 [Entomortierella chlamydospora]|uniref:Uncharacterized protein n=1 Tax=Entomortierella chlamydospora TaxID=101097 RepID=A0A9P6N1C2_9FUNG|nr:hypothetical protein BGZ79_008444 [Entomortierella chlamydospora]KAG0020499.1 hypothetical protein BGZ80_004102 [Entomortierella chlamydospora]